MRATPLPVFPNYTQIRQPLPMSAWRALRILSVAAAFALMITLVVCPQAGLTLFWGFFIPVAPLLFFVAPGLWRNICPIAALNQAPRTLGFTRGLTLPQWVREQYGYVFGIAFFLAVVPARKALFNDNGPALALLMLAILGAAYLGGLVFKGKSGWCSSGVCPLFPVQRLYGQTPFATVPNSHCRPCVGCAKNCYDFNPGVAYLADINDEDRHYSGYRKFFAGAFPGLILAFYRVPDPPAISVPELYLRFALYILVGVALFFALETFLKVTVHKVTALFGAAALNLYYWFNFPLLAERASDPLDVSVPDALVWAGRLAVFALTAVWLVRTYRKELLFVAQGAASLQPRVGPRGSAALRGSIALRRAAGLGQPEVTFMPEQKRVVVEAGRSLLEIAEKNDLRIEAGCRMGVCGADPVAILSGMENLAPIGDDERNTLERLGLAKNTRMACVCHVRGDVTLALKPERPKEFSSSVVRGFRPDPEVKRVVIAGNGIAGVTAADHVRRRHPMCEVHLVAREQHHLYNRMAIERLIYGRSAMQGLYLQDEKRYDDLNIITWLNTRVTRIDREARQVVLGTGEKLPYDRLILATGSRSFVPPIEGYGMPGTFVMREADDALQMRAFAQEHGCRSAVVAGGGLLGLEAGYALHKLGLHVSILERSSWLLRRQLDERGAYFLRQYLEGMGMEIVVEAEAAAAQGNGRVRQVLLKDGRTLACDLLLVAAGITPNVELAREAGLEVNRGVIVDNRMRTSAPEIYAAGDVAEHRGQVYGIWPTAAEQAQVAAANAVGGEKTYGGSVPATMLKVVGVELMSIGRFEPQSPDDVVIALEEIDEHRYRKLVIADGVIAGAILFGYPLLAPAVTSAIKRCADVTSCLDALRAGDWDVLSRLPEGPPRPEPAGRVPVAAVAAPPRLPAPAQQSAAAAPVPARAPVDRPQPPAQAEPVRVERAEPEGAPAARVRVFLRAEEGPVQGAAWEVDEAGATLGRAPDNSVHIPDDGLSRRHARIECQHGAYWLSDLGSTNGTFVNQVRLTAPHALRSGDVIRLGRTHLAVMLHEAPA